MFSVIAMIPVCYWVFLETFLMLRLLMIATIGENICDKVYEVFIISLEWQFHLSLTLLPTTIVNYSCVWKFSWHKSYCCLCAKIMNTIFRIHSHIVFLLTHFPFTTKQMYVINKLHIYGYHFSSHIHTYCICIVSNSHNGMEIKFSNTSYINNH